MNDPFPIFGKGFYTLYNKKFSGNINQKTVKFERLLRIKGIIVD